MQFNRGSTNCCLGTSAQCLHTCAPQLPDKTNILWNVTLLHLCLCRVVCSIQMLRVLCNFMETEKLIQSAYAAFNLQCMSGHVVCVKPLCRHESERESHLVTLTINILHSMAESDSASLYMETVSSIKHCQLNIVCCCMWLCLKSAQKVEWRLFLGNPSNITSLSSQWAWQKGKTDTGWCQIPLKIPLHLRLEINYIHRIKLNLMTYMLCGNTIFSVRLYCVMRAKL